MLKNVDPLLVPRLLHRLAAMGHGDEIAVVDRNYPAYSAGPEVIELAGVGTTEAVRAILTVLPLDTFVDRPVLHMEPVSGEPVLPIHREVLELASAAEGRGVAAQRLAAMSSTSGLAPRRRSWPPPRTGPTDASCSSRASSADARP